MKTKLIFLIAIILSFVTINMAQTGKLSTTGVHKPAKGSAERRAILDALRTPEAAQFKVSFMRVHDGWAWADTTPLDKAGKPIAEGGPNLLQLVKGTWKVMDLSRVPEDPNDPMGAEDASKVFVANLRRTFPGVPADIFPKPSH
jgi:hypothetical protein